MQAFIKVIVSFKDYIGLLFVSIFKNFQRRQVVKHANKSHKIREDVRSMSDGELNDELRKYTRVRKVSNDNSR